MLKTCKICGEEKEHSAFHKHPKTKDGLDGRCKQCKSKALSARWKNLPVEEKNKISQRESEQRYKRKFGLTKAKVDRMQSAGQCEICLEYFDTRVIDHCHSTGEVRGSLCSNCNLMLGHAKDSIETLKKAIEYLAN